MHKRANFEKERRYAFEALRKLIELENVSFKEICNLESQLIALPHSQSKNMLQKVKQSKKQQLACNRYLSKNVLLSYLKAIHDSKPTLFPGTDIGNTIMDELYQFLTGAEDNYLETELPEATKHFLRRWIQFSTFKIDVGFHSTLPQTDIIDDIDDILQFQFVEPNLHEFENDLKCHLSFAFCDKSFDEIRTFDPARCRSEIKLLPDDKTVVCFCLTPFIFLSFARSPHCL